MAGNQLYFADNAANITHQLNLISNPFYDIDVALDVLSGSVLVELSTDNVTFTRLDVLGVGVGQHLFTTLASGFNDAWLRLTVSSPNTFVDNLTVAVPEPSSLGLIGLGLLGLGAMNVGVGLTDDVPDFAIGSRLWWALSLAVVGLDSGFL
jgi:hypothetical protein